MNIIEKSESIRADLHKGFRDGTAKMAQRRCYGYNTGPDGELVIYSDEAAVVRWIFDRYISGDSLGKIAAGLEAQGIPSPTGKPKWNREAINKLISNEKYTGQVLLQKTVSTGGSKIKNDGIVDRYLYPDSHEAIISDELFRTVLQEKLEQTVHLGKEHPYADALLVWTKYASAAIADNIPFQADPIKQSIQHINLSFCTDNILIIL